MKTSPHRFCRWLALSIVGCCCLVTTSAQAEDWPQWRGPNRDGKSADTGLLKQWPTGGPKLAWKATGLGKGYSNMSVAAGRLFTMGDKDGADGWGGGLINYLATLTLKGVIVTQNVALGGSPGGKGIGGGVHVYKGGTYSADSTTVIEKNKATTSNDNVWP